MRACVPACACASAHFWHTFQKCLQPLREIGFSVLRVALFVLFINEVAGGNWSMLLCVTWCWKHLTEWVF